MQDDPQKLADAGAWAALAASEIACYRWPDDTPEHEALRHAFVEGAQIEAGRRAPSPAVGEDADFVEVLSHFTNYVQNERVRSYNEGVDAGRASAPSPAVGEHWQLVPTKLPDEIRKKILQMADGTGGLNPDEWDEWWEYALAAAPRPEDGQ